MNNSLLARLAFAFAGAGLAVAGTVLLVRAAWGALAIVLGPIWASAIVGFGLVLLGALGFALSHRRRPAPSNSALFDAFFQGMRAGQAASGRRG